MTSTPELRAAKLKEALHTQRPDSPTSYDVANIVTACLEKRDREKLERSIRVEASREAASNIRRLLFCIGGPLNDNREQYTFKQLQIFSRINEELEALELSDE